MTQHARWTKLGDRRSVHEPWVPACKLYMNGIDPCTSGVRMDRHLDGSGSVEYSLGLGMLVDVRSKRYGYVWSLNKSYIRATERRRW